MKTGCFVISLDFELHWGVSDHRTVESYRENLANTPEVVRRTLKLFEEREIHATWATVGMLMCRDRDEIFSMVPDHLQPSYRRNSLSNFSVAKEAGNNESDDPFHFAGSLVKQIAQTPGQELGTHTFSHFYCLEPGQNPEQFAADLKAAVTLSEREGVKPVSIVFPRNQYAPEYLKACEAEGLKIYRGNYPASMYRPQAKSVESLSKRMLRLVDAYLPLTGQRVVRASQEDNLYNIPASCFLRPYSKKRSMIEPLRLRRIKNEMTAAARRKGIYHLWWHPHNMGSNMDSNFEILEKILDHFQKLGSRYGMRSLNMKEVYEQR